MLDQIIYTECIPQRDLLNNGKIIRKSGYGVFSLSQELFSGQKVNNYSRLYDLLVYNNGSKEKDSNIGTFGSYLYTNAAGTADCFIHDFGRPHCKNPLKERLHRSGIHIKQCLVGNFEDYPCRWIGASVWDAHLVHEDNYFMNEPANFEPPFLRQLSSSLPEGAGVPFEMARAFIKSGRGKLLSAAVSFVLEQLRREETRQRVLLIRDTPKNVELWITAISYCLPIGLAKRITFNTNISNMSSKPEAKLFYPAEPIPEGVDPETVAKKPFFLIAGYHPFDDSCVQLKQLNSTQFVILDAENETFDYEPKNLDTPYFAAVSDYSRELELFCGSILTSSVSKPESINLPELFEAYEYLLHNAMQSPDYKKVLLHLQNLTKAGLPAQQLTEQLLQECLGMYKGFSSEDQKNNYALLEIMTKMGKQCRREAEVSACISDTIRATLAGGGNGDTSLTANWNSIKDSVLSELMQPMLAEYINDYRLAEFFRTMPQAKPEEIETMLDMMITMLHNQGHMAEAIFSSQIKMSFFYQGMMMLIDHEERLLHILSKVAHSPQLMDFLTYNVGVMLIFQQPEKAYHWFDILMDKYDMSSINVCEWMCKFPQITIDKVEEFLTHRVELQNKVEGTLITSLNNSMKVLGKNDTTGITFFKAASKTFTVQQSPGLMTLVQKCSITNEAACRIFDMVDKRMLMYSFEPEIKDSIFEALTRWAKKLEKTPRSSIMAEFIKVYERADSESRLLDAILRFVRPTIVLSDEFIKSDYFLKLVAKTEVALSGHVHFALLTMLDSEDRSVLAGTYVSRIMERNGKLNPDRQLIALGSAAVLNYKIPNIPEEQLDKVKTSLLEAIEAYCVDNPMQGLDIKISKARDCDKAVKEALLNILNPELAQKKSGGISKLFRFGRS